ncbi:hypothetical protein BGZ61DRAFT_540400 [Ilyonectria robusta]|uniref:uncharacterized protein n=1 Tax=Ilyonectria robusta TaxID=1079257 RepID=UPI001E8CD01E|nr:uncharacterized protein BGZ61DRAFT_540400 [Ilyonectria robusta]KAH8658883.1 hypothetical protein BGZ61DRAFT_540400 [Ilyonectria robusta]
MPIQTAVEVDENDTIDAEEDESGPDVTLHSSSTYLECLSHSKPQARHWRHARPNQQRPKTKGSSRCHLQHHLLRKPAGTPWLKMNTRLTRTKDEDDSESDIAMYSRNTYLEPQPLTLNRNPVIGAVQGSPQQRPGPAPPRRL